jgi:hypothetical protein
MAETATDTPAEPEVNLSTIPAGTPDEDVVKPVALANELKIKPQIVFGWIRTGGLNSYKNKEGKNVILRSEYGPWAEEKAKKRQEREERAATREAEAKAKAEAAKEAPATEGATTSAGTAEEVF